MSLAFLLLKVWLLSILLAFCCVICYNTVNKIVNSIINAFEQGQDCENRSAQRANPSGARFAWTFRKLYGIFPYGCQPSPCKQTWWKVCIFCGANAVVGYGSGPLSRRAVLPVHTCICTDVPVWKWLTFTCIYAECFFKRSAFFIK